MPDNPAKDPAGNEKVGKKGLLTGKNKWYVVGGLGIVAVLVFFFVSRSSANAGGSTTATTSGPLDPSTQAALDSALQGAGSNIGLQGPAGPAGPAGTPGKPGKPGKNAHEPTPTRGKPHPGPMRPAKHWSSFYTVRPGDTLSKIANRHNISGGWEALYHHNRGIIGSNPNVIHPGQRLKI